jgi:molybdopterin/thiamine biosynthesis adenylyltransferase
MNTSFEVRLTRALSDEMEASLRAGPRDGREFEQAGFLLCGFAALSDRDLLLGRCWRPIPLDRRVPGRRFGLAWTAEFNAEILDAADALHMVPVLVHRHQSSLQAAFSVADRTAGDALLSRMSALGERRLAAAVVLHETTVAGVLWVRGAMKASMSRLRIVDVPIQDMFPRVASASMARPRLARQSLAIGPRSDSKLARARVAVAGLSGGGSHVVQQLAHAGVGALVLLDDEPVDETNRGRLVGSRHDDDGVLKTEVMRRLVEGIDPSISIRAVPHRTSTREGLAAIREADIIVACVDRFDARAQINAIARRYLIPLVDIGMTLKSDGESLKVATGQAVLVVPGSACERCMPLLSDAVLDWERKVAPPGYDRNPDALWDAQVVSMNGVLASQAVSVVLEVLTGYLVHGRLKGGGWWQFDAIEGQLDFTPWTFRRPDCPGCTEEAQGDPWFERFEAD